MDHSDLSSDYYMPGGEPFLFKGSDIGCLCLHGLQAVPQEMLWLGKHLAGQGYTVYAPRIAGHGTAIDQLRHIKWQDWYGSALDAYALLRQQCRRVFVMGLSMGGLLSLHLGTREQPDGVICMAGPLQLNQPQLPYARYLKYVRPYTDSTPDENHFRIDRRMREIQAAQGEPVIGRAAYGYFPVASLAELYDLMNVTVERLPQLTAPLQLIYSEGDQTVPAGNMDLAASRVGTPAERLHLKRMQQSNHLLTLDVEMDTVFATVSDFVRRYEA